MADRSGTALATATAPANKLAMSRALGAAFLNHQVEQLEKTVTNGPSSGNWRDRERDNRRQSPTGGVLYNATSANPKRPSAKPPRKKVTHDFVVERREKREARRSSEDARPGKGDKDKDADVVVVDASVLVHALHQVKKWCREGRNEIVIVPLEALNTLDLLKKGTTPLAQRARAASRILEAQVGTNPRIRVQQDDAFVLWDKIAFKDVTSTAATTESEKEKNVPVAQSQATQSSPEWVRRTICCAQWEVDKPSPKESTIVKKVSTSGDSTPKKVLLAVLSATFPPASVQAVPQSAGSAEVTPSPVPLPAPHHPQHASKHEVRAAGTLVGYWAAKAGIEMLEVKPTPPSSAGVVSEDEETTGRKRGAIGSRGRGSDSVRGGGKGESVGRGGGMKHDVGMGRGGGMVERPPAVMAMMELVSQPTKVVRLLARGEKLDPDP